jgi:D-glycero-D-manno-heptose 1,7-bisphosphate phosphatase
MRQALVLVGGRGTRLGALAHDTPKPLMPIAGDKRFLDYLLEHLARFGLREALLLAGHLGEQIEARYSDRAIGAMRLKVVREASPAGTGGALHLAAPHLDDVFVMTNGDSWFDFNLLALAEALSPKDVAALALRQAPDGSRYGTVVFDHGKITAFREKDAAQTGPALISGGVYLLRKSALAHIPHPPSSIEQDLFPALAASNRLSGKIFDGYFIDIGLPETLAQAQAETPLVARRPAVFFDRDGCLNQDDGYTHRVEDLRWIDGAREAVRQVNDAGWLAIVATNQGGIGKGLYDEAAMHRFHAAMQADLAAIGAHIDAFYFNPYHPEAVIQDLRRADHPDRKPNPGMLLAAARDWPIAMEASFLIGDQDSDLAAAAAAGVGGVKFTGGRLDACLTGRLKAHRPIA